VVKSDKKLKELIERLNRNKQAKSMGIARPDVKENIVINEVLENVESGLSNDELEEKKKFLDDIMRKKAAKMIVSKKFSKDE
jgi:DNA polymerase II large subunit